MGVSARAGVGVSADVQPCMCTHTHTLTQTCTRICARTCTLAHTTVRYGFTLLRKPCMGANGPAHADAHAHAHTRNYTHARARAHTHNNTRPEHDPTVESDGMGSTPLHQMSQNDLCVCEETESINHPRNQSIHPSIHPSINQSRTHAHTHTHASTDPPT